MTRIENQILEPLERPANHANRHEKTSMSAELKHSVSVQKDTLSFLRCLP
jgi:hypothetical protein